MSIGDGMYSMTASSSACTPLFLNAVPHMHGHDLVRERARAQALRDLGLGQLPVSRYLFISSSFAFGRGLDHLLRAIPRPAACSFGRDLAYSNFMPWVSIVPVDRLHLDAGRRRPRSRPRRRSAAGSAPGWRAGALRSARRTRKKLAPARSILLTNAMRGTPYLFICRHTVSDCGCTPATAQNSAHRAVEHAQGALDLDREVDVARACR